MPEIMTDSELINYCAAHSRTEVGAISGEMFARLHELAGEPDETTRAVRGRQWWYPAPEWVDRLAAQARERLDAILHRHP
jgi:hypothetical protein